jgi:hypothetical protein
MHIGSTVTDAVAHREDPGASNACMASTTPGAEENPRGSTGNGRYGHLRKRAALRLYGYRGGLAT